MNETSEIFDRGYKSFADDFRGPEAAIRERLGVYLPLIAGVDSTLRGGRTALDLGSGRGEWLALVSEHGWKATGVEPNSISEASKGIDATVIQADALDYLRQCAANSFGLVTAFHIVEHLETEYLLQLLRQILRVLIPGGLLIMETPNPENLTVATWSFHLDPTHNVPIPPNLLRYHAEVAGFATPQIVRLNGIPDEGNLGPLSTVLSVLFRSGRDYAIVARAPGANDELFAALIHNFTLSNSQRNPADIQALIELTKFSDAAIENQSRAIANFGVLESHLHQKHLELQALYASSSWRFSRPLRIASRLVSQSVWDSKRLARSTLVRTRNKLRRHPRLVAALIAILRFSPSLRRRLRSFSEPRVLSAPNWAVDVDPQALADWEKTLHRL